MSHRIQVLRKETREVTITINHDVDFDTAVEMALEKAKDIDFDYIGNLFDVSYDIGHTDCPPELIGYRVLDQEGAAFSLEGYGYWSRIEDANSDLVEAVEQRPDRNWRIEPVFSETVTVSS